MQRKVNKFQLKEVEIKEIVFVKKNARFMKQVSFLQLVENIKQDGQLSSVPFCVLLENGKNKGKYEVISGNHRVKAAKQAGIVKLWIMYCGESFISNDQKIAIQLSHNSIQGQDDLEILRDLVNEITDLNLKEYAHIDESAFEHLDKINYDIIQPDNDIVRINLIFYEHIKADFDKLIQELETFTPKELENFHLLPKAQFKNFNYVLGKVQEKYKIKSAGIAVMKMVEITKNYLDNERRKHRK